MASPDPEHGDHPIGTLIIVGLFGLLFTVGWFLMYFGVFRPRGPIGP